MNMTDNDKELALRLAKEIQERDFGIWLKQAASGFDEVFLQGTPPAHYKGQCEYFYHAGAASQHPAALTKNSEHWQAECRAAIIQRDMLGEALSKVFESVIPYREDGTSSIPDAVVEFCNLAMKTANQKWSYEK